MTDLAMCFKIKTWDYWPVFYLISAVDARTFLLCQIFSNPMPNRCVTLNLLTSFRFNHYLDPSKRQPHPCSFCTDSDHLSVCHVLYHVFFGEEHCSFHYKRVRKVVFVYRAVFI